MDPTKVYQLTCVVYYYLDCQVLSRLSAVSPLERDGYIYEDF